MGGQEETGLTTEIQDDRLWVPSVRGLRTTAVQAVIKFLGPMVIGPGHSSSRDDTAFALRDSMLYRAQSVGYHIDLIKTQFASLSDQGLKRLGTHPQDKTFLFNGRQFLTFLSDDILFNAISMLDYLGNLVGFILAPPSTKLKWNGVVKSCLDHSNALHNTDVANTIITLHREWIDKLHYVRSRIIHERMALGNGKRTISFPSGSGLALTLFFEMPPTVVKRLRFLQDLRQPDGTVDIVAGSECIGLRAIDAATSVMTALLHDLGGAIAPTQ